MVWQTTLDSWCGVPNQMNCFVSVQLQAVSTHPVTDLLNAGYKLSYFVVHNHGICMKVQLAVICIGVYSKATSSGDSYDISTVNLEEDWSQYIALRHVTGQK